MTNLRLDVEYDGAAFSGWAAQPGLRTVESVVTEALRVFWPGGGRPAVAGRTDTGVHAAAQVVSVDVSGGPEVARVPAALNGFGLWNVLVLVLMLLAYGYPIAQFVIDPSPAAMVHRMH